MAEIIIRNKTSLVTGLGPGERTAVDHRLSYKPKNYQWTTAYKTGRWDGRRRLFWNGSAFPTGLAGMVQDTLRGLGTAVTVRDERTRPVGNEPLEFLGEDRDYQGIEDTCIAATRGIINFATGAGKTAVASRIIARLNLPTLYIVPTRELLSQTSGELEDMLGVEVGRIGGGVFDPRRVTVATVQLLYRVLRDRQHRLRERLRPMWDGIDILVVDESHHLGASSYYRVAQAVDAYYRFGLTGTAFRTDNADMMIQAVTGRVLGRISSSELIGRGVLARTHVRLYRVPHVTVRSDHWSDVYGQGVVRNERRNLLIADIVLSFISEAKTVLIIVKEIEHGRILTGMIPGAVFVHGSLPQQVRDDIRREFRARRIPALVATKIYDEGVDVPSMNALVMAAGGKSAIQTIQRVGRALRKSEGKDEVTICDFMDDGHRLLRSHAASRMAIYRSEPGFEVEVVDGQDS